MLPMYDSPKKTNQSEIQDVQENVPFDEIKSDRPPIKISSQRNPREKDECRLCHSEDDISELIRPCICRGTIQYVHQVCLKKDVECNYMDESQSKFNKELKCSFCRNYFIIKTYRLFTFSKALDPMTRHTFIMYLAILTAVVASLIGWIWLITYYSSSLPINIYALMFLGLLCLISLGAILKVTLLISEHLTIFYWNVIDRQALQIKDKGEVTKPEIVQQLIYHFQSRSLRQIAPSQ